MSKRTIKLIIFSVLSILGIAFCAALFIFASEYNTVKPVVGCITSENVPYLNLVKLQNDLEFSGSTLIKNEPGETISAAVSRMHKAGARVIISADETDATNGAALMNATKELGITLLYVGLRPSQSILEESDKAWYLGSDSAHGGELIGAAIANEFKSGAIPDVNGDHLLQLMIVSESVFTQFALEESEHLGVYTDVLKYTDELGNALPYTAEAFSGSAKPEFILCSTENDARIIRELASDLGWFDGDHPIRIGCGASNASAAQALLDDGITDIPVPYYDVDSVTAAAADFAQNILDFNFISQNTEFTPNSDDRFIVPYQLMQ